MNAAGLAPEDQLGRRPLHARGHAVAAELDRQPEPPPLAVPQHAVGVLQRLGQRDGMGGGVEDRRVAVGVGEGRGERAGGHGVELAQGVARDLDVDALERAAAEVFLHAEDLEEVELDVAQVAPEVPHGPSLPVGNISVLPIGNQGNRPAIGPGRATPQRVAGFVRAMIDVASCLGGCDAAGIVGWRADPRSRARQWISGRSPGGRWPPRRRRRSSTARAGAPGPTARSCRCGTRSPSRSSCTTRPRPTRPTSARAPRSALSRSIQNFHMDRRGWLDTGQHFTVSRGGFAMEGRHRSLEIVRAGRQQVEGAHCTGQNVVAVGIENEGTYTSVDPPPAQWNRLRDLCAWICNRYGIAAHRAVRPPRLQEHRLPGRPALRPAAAAAVGRGRGARAAGVGGGEGVVAAPAGGRPGPRGHGRAVPPARRARDDRRPDRRLRHRHRRGRPPVPGRHRGRGGQRAAGRRVVAGAGPHHAARHGRRRRSRGRHPGRGPRRRRRARPRDDARLAAPARHGGRPREPDPGPPLTRVSVSPTASPRSQDGESPLSRR